MTDKLEQAISDARRGQHEARAEAERLIERIAAASSAYVVELAKYYMDRALRDRPEVIGALPQEELSALKASYEETLVQLPDLTREQVSAMSWPHRAEIPESLRTNTIASFDLARQTQEALDQLVRELVGRVGVLLISAKLADVKPRSEWKIVGKSVSYAYGLTEIGAASAQYRKFKEEYRQALDNYTEASQALYAAERAKQQATARDRWEKS